MFIKFTTKLSQILLATVIISSAMNGVAKAESIPETFVEAYFENSGDAFDNGSILGQFKFLFGIGGFAETKIANDGKLVDIIYHDVMHQQTEGGPRLVTRDLSNPFDTSVADNPEYIRINRSSFNQEFDTGF